MKIIINFNIINFNQNTNKIKIIYFLTNIYENILVYLKYIFFL